MMIGLDGQRDSRRAVTVDKMWPQVCAEMCTYQPMKTSRECCKVERVDSGFRRETASNGWISACQRMAGAELQDLWAEGSWYSEKVEHQAMTSGHCWLFICPSVPLLQRKTTEQA